MFVKIIDTTANDQMEFPGANVTRWYLRDTYVDIHFKDTTSSRYTFKTNQEALRFMIGLANAIKQSTIGSSTVTCATDPDAEVTEDEETEEETLEDESSEEPTQEQE